MRNPNATRLTREEFLQVIDNYRNNGRDTAELERALEEAFPSTVRGETPTVDAKIAELRKQSPVTEGDCSICGTRSTLLGGVCETCFLPWATKVAEDNMTKIAGAHKTKRRQPLDKRQEKRFEIIDYALEHNFVIDPSKGMERFIDNIVTFGYCPCDSTRPNCPCPQAEAEVERHGHCRCSLFWADYGAFRKTLRSIKEEGDE